MQKKKHASFSSLTLLLLRQIPLCLSSGERGSERVEREGEMLRGKREMDNLCCPFFVDGGKIL